MGTSTLVGQALGRNRPDEAVAAAKALPFIMVHVAALMVFFVPFSWKWVALCGGLYFVKMFGITGGYHRYFAHRTFRTSRAFQFFLAFLATSSVQKGPLWWAANHRLHHRYSDQPGDPHSPRRGLWYAHQGWIDDPEWSPTRVEQVPDLDPQPIIVGADPVAEGAVPEVVGEVVGGREGEVGLHRRWGRPGR